jgi:uncharacterized RDD family membrane protein YckC
VPMHVAMNTFAEPSAGSPGGPQLDNRRVLAGLIDLAIVLVGTLAIGFVTGLYDGGTPTLSLPVVAVMVAWALYYYFACESGGGQTVGKRLMGLRVVRVDGQPAGMREIGVRTVVRVLDMQFAYLVGLIAMLATGKRRGRLGDLAAGTMVVAAEATPPPPATTASPAEGEVEETTGETAEPVQEEQAAVESELTADEPQAGPTLPAEDLDEPDVRPAFPAEDLAELDRYADQAAVPPDPPVDDLDELDRLDDQGGEHAHEEPDVVIRSVDTISAIDLVMADDRPADDEPDWDARSEPDRR